MSQWRIKCTKLTSQIRGKSARLADLTTYLADDAGNLHKTGLKFTEDKARENHISIAALDEQYDQCILIVNRLVRLTRSRSNAKG